MHALQIHIQRKKQFIFEGTLSYWQWSKFCCSLIFASSTVFLKLSFDYMVDDDNYEAYLWLFLWFYGHRLLYDQLFRKFPFSHAFGLSPTSSFMFSTGCCVVFCDWSVFTIKVLLLLSSLFRSTILGKCNVLQGAVEIIEEVIKLYDGFHCCNNLKLVVIVSIFLASRWGSRLITLEDRIEQNCYEFAVFFLTNYRGIFLFHLWIHKNRTVIKCSD